VVAMMAVVAVAWAVLDPKPCADRCPSALVSVSSEGPADPGPHAHPDPYQDVAEEVCARGRGFCRGFCRGLGGDYCCYLYQQLGWRGQYRRVPHVTLMNSCLDLQGGAAAVSAVRLAVSSRTCPSEHPRGRIPRVWRQRRHGGEKARSRGVVV
jgi:hypothetical protein